MKTDRLKSFQNSILISGLTILLLSCTPSNAQDGTVQRIDNKTLIELKKDSNLQLVDVRTPGEFQRGYIEGAQLVDFTGSSFSEKVAKLDRDRPIVVYCAVGGRSYQSTRVLKDLGFKEVYDLKGGINEWLKEGLPIKK